MLAEGRGVPRDEARARVLAAKACDARLFEGCMVSGGLLATGRGGPVDRDAAARVYRRAQELAPGRPGPAEALSALGVS
jgi:uncharacterized protein